MHGFIFPFILDEEATKDFANFANGTVTHISLPDGEEFGITDEDRKDILDYCHQMEKLNEQYPLKDRYNYHDEAWNAWNTQRMMLFSRYCHVLLMAIQVIDPKITTENSTEDSQSKPPGLNAIVSISDLPYLHSSGPPKKHAIPNNYLANELQHGCIIDAGSLNLPSLGTSQKALKKGKLITTSVIAAYQPNEDVTIQGNYTEYDRQVQNAICSLWLYGDPCHIVTPAMVYRAMTNNDAVQPSPQQLGAVTRSIEKQWNIFVSIDASAEFEKRGIRGEDGKPIKWKRKQHLLEMHLDDVKNGKKITKAYTLLSEPLLLTYSRLTKQLLTVKSELLDIKRVDSTGTTHESITNTESRISIKGYLLRRIEVIKHDIQQAKANFQKYGNKVKNDPSLPKKSIVDFMQQNHRILFETVFYETGQQNSNRETQRRNRDYAIQCLDYWKAIGHIKDYSIVKGEKNKIRGVLIIT